jgi:hypothetical protein
VGLAVGVDIAVEVAGGVCVAGEVAVGGGGVGVLRRLTPYDNVPASVGTSAKATVDRSASGLVEEPTCRLVLSASGCAPEGITRLEKGNTVKMMRPTMTSLSVGMSEIFPSINEGLELGG